MFSIADQIKATLPRLLTPLLAAALLATACAAQPAAEPDAGDQGQNDPAAFAETLTCHVAYRPAVTVPIEREETITLGDVEEEETLSFADLDFHAAYTPGEVTMERSLRLWVTPAGSQATLTSQLYQLAQESGPHNQFQGGHGFTGLTYVYHPETGAEMQFWCTAE